MAKYRLSPQAQRDLDAIFDYTTAHWGLEQALRYVDLIEAACAQVAEAPEAASACDDIRQGYRRRVVESHLIYFYIEPYGIAVVRIFMGEWTRTGIFDATGSQG